MPAGMPDPSGTGTWTRTTLVCERQAASLAAERFPVPEFSIVTEVSLLSFPFLSFPFLSFPFLPESST